MAADVRSTSSFIIRIIELRDFGKKKEPTPCQV
jgi:hypothetical protein